MTNKFTNTVKTVKLKLEALTSKIANLPKRKTRSKPKGAKISPPKMMSKASSSKANEPKVVATKNVNKTSSSKANKTKKVSAPKIINKVPKTKTNSIKERLMSFTKKITKADKTAKVQPVDLKTKNSTAQPKVKTGNFNTKPIAEQNKTANVSKYATVKAEINPGSASTIINALEKPKTTDSMKAFFSKNYTKVKKSMTKRNVAIIASGCGVVGLTLLIGLPVGLSVNYALEHSIKPSEPSPEVPNLPGTEGGQGSNTQKPDQGTENPGSGGSGQEQPNKPTDKPVKPEPPKVEIMTKDPNVVFNEIFSHLDSTKKILPDGKLISAKDVNINNYTKYVSFFHGDSKHVKIEVKKVFPDPKSPTTIKFAMTAWLLNYPYPDRDLPSYINSTWSVYWDHFTISGFKPEPSKPISSK